MSARASLTGWSRRNPNAPMALVVAVLVIGASAWLGLRARTARGALIERRAVWESAANQLATVQQQFRVPTSTESSALIAESSRMGALGVPAGDRLALVESMGRLAEACGLSGVRANALPATDSIHVADRRIGSEEISRADYVVSVEFTGGFAGVVQFVSSLPPSVSLGRLRAFRDGSVTTYQLVLSVYELDAKPAG